MRRVDKVLLAGAGVTLATLLILGAVNPELASDALPVMAWLGGAWAIRFALWPRDRHGNLKEPPPPDPPTAEDVHKSRVAFRRLTILAFGLLIAITGGLFVTAYNTDNPVGSTALLLAVIVACTAVWQFTRPR